MEYPFVLCPYLGTQGVRVPPPPAFVITYELYILGIFCPATEGSTSTPTPWLRFVMPNLTPMYGRVLEDGWSF